MVEPDTNIYLGAEVRTVTMRFWPKGPAVVKFGFLFGIGFSLGVAAVASVATLIVRAVS